MSWSLFLPLIIAAFVYGAISAAAGVVSSRGDDERAERVRDWGFLLLLAMAAWTLILFIVSIFNEPNDVGDMITITLVIVVFFALLLLVFFGISIVAGAISRSASRRSRVTTEDL
jgi:hypothetical protein